MRLDKLVEKPPIKMNPIAENQESEVIERPPTIAGRRRPAREWSTDTNKDDILDGLASNTPVPKSQMGKKSIDNLIFIR